MKNKSARTDIELSQLDRQFVDIVTFSFLGWEFEDDLMAFMHVVIF